MRNASRIASVATAFALAVAACGGSASSVAPGATATARATNDGGAAPTAKMPAADGGWCKVEVTGDVTWSWETTQTQDTLFLSQWLSAASRKSHSLADKEEAVRLDCGSGELRLSLWSAAGTTSAQFREGPGIYVIALGLRTPGQFGLTFLPNDDKLWRTEKPGTFTVTRFGGGKFIGTFSVKVVAYFDPGLAHPRATITGSFDLGCMGDACN